VQLAGLLFTGYFLGSLFQALRIVSDTGEDVKVKGARKYAGKKEKGRKPFLSPVTFSFFHVRPGFFLSLREDFNFTWLLAASPSPQKTATLAR